MSHHHTTAEHLRDALVHAFEALSALPDDAALARLAGRVDAVLRDRERLDATASTLRRAVIRSRAHARVADATLDAAIAAFAADVLALGDAQSELYKRFFPEPHDEVIALGLESELPLVTLVLAHLGAQELPASLARHADALRAGLRLGNAALANRSDALADLGRHGAREESWSESAASALSSTRRSLEALARTRGLSSAWVAAFTS